MNIGTGVNELGDQFINNTYKSTIKNRKIDYDISR